MKGSQIAMEKARHKGCEPGHELESEGSLRRHRRLSTFPHLAMSTMSANLTTEAAVAAFFGDAMTALIPSIGTGPMHTVVIVAVLAALAAFNVRGVGNATRFNSIMTAAKLAPLAIIILAGMFALHGDRLRLTHAP